MKLKKLVAILLSFVMLLGTVPGFQNIASAEDVDWLEITFSEFFSIGFKLSETDVSISKGTVLEKHMYDSDGVEIDEVTEEGSYYFKLEASFDTELEDETSFELNDKSFSQYDFGPYYKETLNDYTDYGWCKDDDKYIIQFSVYIVRNEANFVFHINNRIYPEMNLSDITIDDVDDFVIAEYSCITSNLCNVYNIDCEYLKDFAWYKYDYDDSEWKITTDSILEYGESYAIGFTVEDAPLVVDVSKAKIDECNWAFGYYLQEDGSQDYSLSYFDRDSFSYDDNKLNLSVKVEFYFSPPSPELINEAEMTLDYGYIKDSIQQIKEGSFTDWDNDLVIKKEGGNTLVSIDGLKVKDINVDALNIEAEGYFDPVTLEGTTNKEYLVSIDFGYDDTGEILEGLMKLAVNLDDDGEAETRWLYNDDNLKRDAYWSDFNNISPGYDSLTINFIIDDNDVKFVVFPQAYDWDDLEMKIGTLYADDNDVVDLSNTDIYDYLWGFPSGWNMSSEDGEFSETEQFKVLYSGPIYMGYLNDYDFYQQPSEDNDYTTYIGISDYVPVYTELKWYYLGNLSNKITLTELKSEYGYYFTSNPCYFLEVGETDGDKLKSSLDNQGSYALTVDVWNVPQICKVEFKLDDGFDGKILISDENSGWLKYDKDTKTIYFDKFDEWAKLTIDATKPFSGELIVRPYEKGNGESVQDGGYTLNNKSNNGFYYAVLEYDDGWHNNVYSSVFEVKNAFVPSSKGSKTYKASDSKDTVERISGSGKKGSTRTITPQEGRKVGKVVVTDKNGDKIEVTKNEDGTYSFIQPASNVNVEVTYVNREITLTIGSTEADVDGERSNLDVSPVIRNDRTMLPIRFVAENLGAKVEWDEKHPEYVLITKGDIKIEITLGSDKAKVNGKEFTLDSVAFAENDRTYLPVRFVSEQLNAIVEWNEAKPMEVKIYER